MFAINLTRQTCEKSIENNYQSFAVSAKAETKYLRKRASFTDLNLECDLNFKDSFFFSCKKTLM